MALFVLESKKFNDLIILWFPLKILTNSRGNDIILLCVIMEGDYA